MLYLGDTGKIKAPLLSGASCTPCHADRNRVESDEPRYTGDQVLKSLGGSETAIHEEQEEYEPGLCGEERIRKYRRDGQHNVLRSYL